MNAIEFLVNEHNSVRNILTDIANAEHSYETKKNKFEKLCKVLLLHEKIEEEIWYPHFKMSDKLDATVKHLVKEEKNAEIAIQKIQNTSTEQDWIEKFTKFKHDVEHHAAEEETKLFPIVEKILSTSQLESIGKEMREYKLDHSHVAA